MIKKFLQRGLTVILAVSLTIMPSFHVSAQTAPESIKVLADTSADTTKEPALTSLEDVRKLAEQKAATLTSLYGVTSLQYALIENGEIVLSGHSGVYSKESDTPLTNETMYGIGSISKMFTTTAVMQLVEQDKVNLDTPVTTYIPEFTMEDSRYKDITVRMLLNHSSGLMGSTLYNSLLFDDKDFSTYDDFLTSLKTSRLKANPGAYSVYCNDGFTLAELLVERVSGLSFTDYVGKNITKPLSLSDTKTPLDFFSRDSLAKTYIPGFVMPMPSESLNMIGAGGMYSSAEDLCRFGEIFMNDWKSNVLSPVSASRMEYPEYLSGLWPDGNTSAVSYGLGWDSVDTYPFNEYGIKALVKGGDTNLYHGGLVVLPEENMSMAVLSSGGVSTYNEALAEEILLAALKVNGTIDEIKPYKTFDAPVPASMPADMKQYEGIYGNFAGLIKIDINDDGTLTATNPIAPQAGTQKFIYTGDGKFYYTDGSTYVSFANKPNGNTYIYCSGYSLLPGISQITTGEYQGQKLSNNPISSDLKKIWQERADKSYFIVNEKYSSEVYALGAFSANLVMPKELEGYWLNAVIKDESTAETLLQIPGVYGRDLNDYTFFNQDDTEYMNAGGSIYVAENYLTPLLADQKHTYTINEEGYASWYKIDEKTAGKNMKVLLPRHSAFAVYDANGACINYSYVTKTDTATLPSEGYIVFVGDKDSEFDVKFIE